MNMETGGFGGDDRRRYLVPALIVVAALVVLLLIIGITSAVRGRNASQPIATSAATPRPAIVATPATRTTGAFTSPRPSSVPSAAPSSAPGVVPSSAPSASAVYIIANTGGDNINLRRTASTSAEIVARLAEGDKVTEIGPTQMAEGREWRNVRTADGIDGWVASEFTQKAP